MTQSGHLWRLSTDRELPELAGESAVLFAVGDGASHLFALWPTRFEDAVAGDPDGTVIITTHDERLRVFRSEVCAGD